MVETLAARDYRRMATAIRYLAEHREERPDLEAVAGRVGLSPYHFQRLFRRWTGVSPRQLGAVLTLEAARRRLAESAPVLESALAAGLSSPSRLHDLFVNVHAATPGEFRGGGAGVSIHWGWHESPFGDCFVAATSRGVCFLAFDDGDRERPLIELTEDWPAADVVEDPGRGARHIASAFSSWQPDRVPLHLKGTNFQLQVWRALLAIPEGAVTTYGRLAAALGRPKAARAVASAVARNPVSWFIPCHRIIRGTGEFWKYRWGVDRKRAMLACEALATSRSDDVRMHVAQQGEHGPSG